MLCQPSHEEANKTNKINGSRNWGWGADNIHRTPLFLSKQVLRGPAKAAKVRRALRKRQLNNYRGNSVEPKGAVRLRWLFGFRSFVDLGSPWESPRPRWKSLMGFLSDGQLLSVECGFYKDSHGLKKISLLAKKASESLKVNCHYGVTSGQADHLDP